jgi:hypothetical protein
VNASRLLAVILALMALSLLLAALSIYDGTVGIGWNDPAVPSGDIT